MHISYLENHSIDTDFAQQIAASYISVGMGNAYNNEFIQTLFKNSAYHALAIQDGQVIGLIRALSDGVLTSWIAEILVKPEYQGRGVGSKLLQDFTQRFSNTAIYIDSLKGDSQRFFEKNGIKQKNQTVNFAIAPQEQ